MILLIKKERPADPKCNVLCFILDNQWFNLTAHDIRTALVNARLEYHESHLSWGKMRTPCSSLHVLVLNKR